MKKEHITEDWIFKSMRSNLLMNRDEEHEPVPLVEQVILEFIHSVLDLIENYASEPMERNEFIPLIRKMAYKKLEKAKEIGYEVL